MRKRQVSLFFTLHYIIFSLCLVVYDFVFHLKVNDIILPALYSCQFVCLLFVQLYVNFYSVNCIAFVQIK